MYIEYILTVNKNGTPIEIRRTETEEEMYAALTHIGFDYDIKTYWDSQSSTDDTSEVMTYTVYYRYQCDDEFRIIIKKNVYKIHQIFDKLRQENEKMRKYLQETLHTDVLS